MLKSFVNLYMNSQHAHYLGYKTHDTILGFKAKSIPQAQGEQKLKAIGNDTRVLFFTPFYLKITLHNETR